MKKIKNNNKYQYLLLDTTNLFFKCYFSVIKGHEISHKEVTKDETAEIVHLMLELTNYLRREFAYDDSEVFFLFDNPNTAINMRQLMSVDYKSSRDLKRFPTNVYSILRTFSNIIKIYSSNYRVLFAEKLEADDLTKPLIAYLKPDLTSKCLCISDDMDWARNISDVTNWFNWKTVYDSEQFYKDYYFFPVGKKVCIWKAFAGDTSDSIKPAIPYFKREDISELCNTYNDIDEIIKDAREYKLGSKSGKIITHYKELRSNYDLVDFIDIERPISEYIYRCREDVSQGRVLLISLGIEPPVHMLTEEEKANNFFSV